MVEKVQPPERFYQLDSLRGLATIGIIILHLRHFGVMPLYALLKPLYIGGYHLVSLFFIISGFLLTHKYLKKNTGTVAHNIKDRLIRLYPLHFITLMAVLVGQYILFYRLEQPWFEYTFNNAKHFFLNLFLINQIGLQDGFSFNGPAWFLSCLLFANIIFFLLIAKKKHILALIIVSCLASIVLLMFLETFLSAAAFDRIFYLLLALIEFFAGALLYYAYHSVKQIKSWFASSKISVPIVLLSVVLTSMIMLRGYIAGLHWLTYLALIPLFSIMIIASISSPALRFLNWSRLVYLGKISFSAYILHFPIQLAIWLFCRWSGISIRFDSPIFIFFFFLATFLIASLSFKYIEQPITHLRKKKLQPLPQ